MPQIKYIYPYSHKTFGGSEFCIAIADGEKSLIIKNVGDAYRRFRGREETADGARLKICGLTHENAVEIRGVFPFTRPSSHAGHNLTVGLGDRLGLASPGHIRLIRDMDVFPVLAQQSIRELTLTGRTFDEVLDAATWAVFQEGYEKGFGADGDHLKTANEVKTALDAGYTMITLDCSEHIKNSAANLPDDEIDILYADFTHGDARSYESDYFGKTFDVGGAAISFDERELKRTAVIYGGAIIHTKRIYDDFIIKNAYPVDFEVSIDETPSPTSPAAHFFVANELAKSGVKCVSVAPRFCGEFQKGIDYKGDIRQFEREFIIHNKIANHFGYKLSVHSGSDKFAVFPIIRKESGGVYHLKTAGTNWLEALRVMARKTPDIFRKIAAYGLAHLHEAKKYYATTENTDNIPDLESLSDDSLPSFLDQDDARQVLHITYGIVLSAEQDGKKLFKDDIYAALRLYENDYYEALIKHIGRHLQ